MRSVQRSALAVRIAVLLAAATLALAACGADDSPTAPGPEGSDSTPTTLSPPESGDANSGADGTTGQDSDAGEDDGGQGSPPVPD